MIEEMPNIDLTGIENLRDLKKDQDVLQDRLEKMEAKKDKVSQSVYERVHADYLTQLDELKQRADPLKREVRAEYAKLKDLMSNLSEELSRVQLEKEEMEFRFELGEYEEKDFKKASKDLETSLAERQADMDEAEQLKAKFLEVFDSEEDLESEAETVEDEQPEAPAEVEEAEEEAVEEEAEDQMDEAELPGAELEEEEDEIEADAEALKALEGEEEPSEEPADEVEEEASHDELEGLGVPIDDGALDEDLEELPESVDELDEAPPPVPMAHDETEASEEVGAHTEEISPPMPPPVPPKMGEPATMKLDKSAFDWSSPPEDEADGTVLISNPKIVSIQDGKEGQVYSLGMGTTSIGRSPENDIHIPEERISRKHAQIAFGPGGYAIYDLNSENGTYVNGNRVREHFLVDGDILLIGTSQFVYREQ